MGKTATAAALNAIPGARPTMAPQGSGMGRVSPVSAEMYLNNPYRNTYGPFHPRPSMTFTDGAFGPMSPIQPVPVDEPPLGGMYPDPRYWQYRTGWNLPTQPGSEGLKLASFDQLRTLSQRYSVARACIDLREQEIRGLEWEITLTKHAAKAYQNNHAMMRDFGERAAQATKFFKRPDPGYWNFSSFLNAMLEEILVYDALALIFRPKYGAKFGRGGRGLLGSDLDSIRLVSGPTIRPLVDMHGDPPAPPAPAYQQYLYGVPRSDYLTIMRGSDIDDNGLSGAQVGEFTSDIMLYAPFWPTRESPYGFPPVERALLPIISGLQKQEFQLDYFTEGTVPAVYISPGDPNITPTQIKELQDALNGIAGDPAYHMKVIVLPPGSKVEPQRPVDLSDSFDYLVQSQVCMAFDVSPIEIGIIPNVGETNQGPSASGIRFAGQEARDIKSRKSTRPMLQWIAGIFDYVLQDICGQTDMRFQFEGLANDEDKQAITELGVQQVQNGIASIDEVRDRLDLAPWGLQETSEPVVFTAQGPIPFSMAPQLIMAAVQNAQGQNSSSSSGSKNRSQGTNSGQRSANTRTRTNQPSIRAGGQTKPNGSHPAPIAPHRESVTPGHSAALGAVQSPTPRTGGTPSRSSVAGSRKKAVVSELDALRRHIRKGRLISTWEPVHVSSDVLAAVAEDIGKGVLLDVAIGRAADLCFAAESDVENGHGHDPEDTDSPSSLLVPLPDIPGMEYPPLYSSKSAQWPGWERDLGLVGAYEVLVREALQKAESRGTDLRKKSVSEMFVSVSTLNGLISDETHKTLMLTLNPLWDEAWHLGYAAGKALATGNPADFSHKYAGLELDAFIGSEGAHWLEEISRTGLKNIKSRSETIARTEVARAMNAGAVQAYRDHGVSHKHLLMSPKDCCDICKDAHDEGIVPLDSIFPGGGLGGPFHPNCRCVPAPAGINVEPPQGHLGKHDDIYPHEHQEDESRIAWLLLRAKDPDGKYRFLLQQRDDGSWGMPGGTTHVGEDGWDAAVRETTEEIGDLPFLNCVATFHHEEDDGKYAYVFLCDVPYFNPRLHGSTPDETQGVGWFRRKEIDDLALAPKFREDWDSSITLRDHVTKNLQRAVDENGQELFLTPAGQELQAVGSRWPYPHRADGTEDPEPHFNQADGEMGASEPPGWRDMSDVTGESRLYPRATEDEEYPKRRSRGKPASRFPDQGGETYPRTTDGGPQSTVAGIPKAMQPPKLGDIPQHGMRLIVGSIPAETPESAEAEAPHPEEPYDPGDSVPVQTPAGNAFRRPGSNKGHGGPSDFSDPNPVDSEHVYLQMAKNFPPDAIQWVKRARWIGPVNVPWDRIDSAAVESWAASHQPEKVGEFAKLIQAHSGHVAPSVAIQDNDSPKAIIIDGHHRALARKKLGMPVLCYVGMIDPRDRQAAEETHSKQIHQGADPRNK